jgi:hypothetical protein
MNATHAVTEVAVIRNESEGVLLMHSPDRRWHLPDATLGAESAWDTALLQGVASATGIRDLTIDDVMLIDTFPAGEVGPEPHYGVFLACSTSTKEVVPGGKEDAYQWMGAETDVMRVKEELFNPLIEELVIARLTDTDIWPAPRDRI